MARMNASVCILSLGLLCGPAALSAQQSAYAAARDSSLAQGYEAYQSGDWTSATLFFRKAVASPSGSADAVWYMLIMSQMYAQEYAAAVNDCDAFARTFPDSPLWAPVQYQKGRALHCLGQNDGAVLALSDFCHQNPGHPMYGSALFWIAECFYDDYNYDAARPLYERVVDEFADEPVAQDARFRLDSIARSEREQKLLYLLKMTGEEYLSARESYERQMKQYQTEDMLGLRRQLNAANARIAELEAAQGGAPAPEAEGDGGVTEDEVAALKAKAAQVRRLLEAAGEAGR